MILLNDAKGVKLIEAGGGWFFKVSKTEVQFYQTNTTKHDGKPVATGTVSIEQMGILFDMIFRAPDTVTVRYTATEHVLPIIIGEGVVEALVNNTFFTAADVPDIGELPPGKIVAVSLPKKKKKGKKNAAK